MKTVGTFLKEAREGRGIDYVALSRSTRIKPEFLQSIEHEQWTKLPELPVLVGFVRSIADALSVSREQAVALLRRDYPPRSLPVNPKPDIKREWRFGPRTLVVLLSLFVVFVLGGYLVHQYKLFTSPPELRVISPVEGELVGARKVTVQGTTDSGAVIRVNEIPVLVDSNGNFTAEIEVVPETTAITVKAISRSGREANVSRKIYVQQNK